MKKDPLNIALYFLKFRPRTIFEVREKLRSKKYEDKEIDKVISVLKRNGLLDDEKFAKMWIVDRNKFKPCGNFLLKLELKKLGIDEVIIEEAISDQDEVELAKQALLLKNRYRNAEFPKQAQFLQRRGFSMNTIYKVLKK